MTEASPDGKRVSQQQVELAALLTRAHELARRLSEEAALAKAQAQEAAELSSAARASERNDTGVLQSSSCRAHLEEPPHAVDDFYKYVGAHLPEEGEIISVVRFLQGRVVRARVTRVDSAYTPRIAATEVG